MDAWWQCEIPYPFVDKAITDAAELGAGFVAEPAVRPADRGNAVR